MGYETRVSTSSPGWGHCTMFLKEMLDPHSAPFHTGVEISTGRFLADLTKCYVDLVSGGREDEHTTHHPEERSIATKCSILILHNWLTLFLKCDYLSTRLQLIVMAGSWHEHCEVFTQTLHLSRSTIWNGFHACVPWAWRWTKEKASKMKWEVFRRNLKVQRDWCSLCHNNCQNSKSR